MAGRPPAASPTGLLVGMCVSVGIALIALVLLVVLWTNQEELKAAADKANSDAQRLMKPSERQGAWADWFNQATGGKSVAKLMHDEMADLGEIISAESATPAPGLAARLHDNQLNGLWNMMEDDEILDDPSAVVERPLVDALTTMYDLYKAEHEAHQRANETAADRQEQIDMLIETNENLGKEFEQEVGTLRARLDVIDEEWKSYRQQKEDQFAAFEKSTQDRADASFAAEQELRGQITGLSQELSKKADRARELQHKLREFQILPQSLMAARQTDGKVLMAKPGEDTVFINLGARDRLVLGIRFAVYPPDTGIPSSGQAKATIEVIDIDENVSTCRILRDNALFPILEGDLIANPVYDRGRSLTFYVLGKFDFDYDGRDDPNGKATLQALIKENGGLIADELSARIDFVIAGARPAVLRLSSNPSPENQAVHDDQSRKKDTYTAAINDAQALSIPIFTQETFLQFMGRVR